MEIYSYGGIILFMEICCTVRHTFYIPKFYEPVFSDCEKDLMEWYICPYNGNPAKIQQIINAEEAVQVLMS